jgi:thioredoxin-like negative regulator of GroEL
MGLLKWLGLASEEKEPLALDDGNFHQEVMRSEVPVLVDVWSPGCAPCVSLAPTIKRLAAKYDGEVKVCHLDASIAPKTMKRLRVRGTPTVLFFKRGAVVETVVGTRGQHYYEEIIEEDLLGRVAEAKSA